jgi:hypothetical protein
MGDPKFKKNLEIPFNILGMTIIRLIVYQKKTLLSVVTKYYKHSHAYAMPAKNNAENNFPQYYHHIAPNIKLFKIKQLQGQF